MSEQCSELFSFQLFFGSALLVEVVLEEEFAESVSHANDQVLEPVFNLSFDRDRLGKLDDFSLG